MDQRFQRAMSELDFRNLKIFHLGAIGKTFYLAGYLAKNLRTDSLEEIGWCIN